MNLIDFIRSAACAEPKLAAVDSQGIEWTWERMLTVIVAVRGVFVDLGGKVTYVVIESDCSVLSGLLSLSVAECGGASIPIPVGFSDRVLREIKGELNVSFHVHSLRHTENGGLQFCIDDQVFFIDPEPSFGWRSYESVANPEAPFLVTLSSGSTGKPKKIVYSQRVKIMRAESAIKEFSVSEADVILNASPFCHSLGQRLFFTCLVAGCTTIAVSDFSAHKWLNAVEKYGVTFTISVSSHLVSVHSILTTAPPPSIRALVASSAGLARGLKEDFSKKELGYAFYEMFGASEVGTAAVLNLTEHPLRRDSVGVPIEGTSIAIYRDGQQVLSAGAVGEIGINSPTLALGYIKNGQLVSISDAGGYFLTGDLGSIDDGYLYFSGRKSEVISSGGINITPEKIESILNDTGLLSGSVVLGAPDSYLGEAVVAFIILKDRDSLALQMRRVRSLLREVLSSNEMPLKIWVLDSFPVLASGKVDRVALRREAARRYDPEVSTKLFGLADKS